MKTKHLINLLIVLIALSPIAYLFLVWTSIPKTFATKFEFDIMYEKVQSRSELLAAVVIVSVVSGLLYLLMHNLSKVDPKVKETTPQSTFHKLGLVLTFFMTTMSYFFILTVKNGWTVNTNVAIGFFGLLMVLLGNYMNNIKPNYFAGFRLPWTLNDPENWRRTHQMAGKLWFVGGIAVLIGSLFMPMQVLKIFAITLLIALTVVPAVYSYRIFRNKVSQPKQ